MCKISKILGHIANANNNLNEAVDERIQKANDAWNNIRNSVITDKNINKKLRLMLCESLITSILLYSLLEVRFIFYASKRTGSAYPGGRRM